MNLPWSVGERYPLRATPHFNDMQSPAFVRIDAGVPLALSNNFLRYVRRDGEFDRSGMTR